MINHYDIAYGLGVGVSAPFWLIKPSARRKVLSAFRERMGTLPASGYHPPRANPRDPAKSAVMIHAVSLGEINATRALVESLRQSDPHTQVIVSTTTETGMARARQLYEGRPDVILVRYPLDFSKAVTRLLDALRPDVVVLMELEVWPNFVRQCAARGVPVVLINGRLTRPSFNRYRWLGPVAGGMFKRLSAVCAQDDIYAGRFVALGVDPQRVRVTGTMKFDTAEVAQRVPGDDELAAAVGLYSGAEPVWVCGSTGPGEEEVILRVYRRLLGRHARLRLAVIPRKPERFDEVADLIGRAKFRVVRRSHTPTAGEATATGGAPGFPLANSGAAVAAGEPPRASSALPPVVLGDTLGELRKFYSLADVVLVGRSLRDLGARQHGSDMIEPAALGRPVVTGRYTGNFAEVMNRLRAADAVMEVDDEESLEQTVSVLLSSPDQAALMGRRAQQVVLRERGATARHAAVILAQLRAREDQRWTVIAR